ncbi:MAG: hypothetical protein L6R38_008355 [Xanthoria sp. 2 TBL-2021]|nr:MAG: hypothetical protein L6R38_008355 [Xanthoria sp. 2 TBL-2021]
MPNRYSHAFVLSRYETKGFITLPPRPLSPPPASLSPSDLEPHAPNGGDDRYAPSLNAVPALSDASTTSTASSSVELPRKPSHSASSSIITEIYAPQALSVDSIPTTYVPAEDDPHDALPPSLSPTRKTHPRQSSPPPPKSRFSSFHDLSPFISKHSLSAKPSKKSHRRHSYLPPVHSTELPPITPRQQPYNPAPYYKRLEPTFDTDSLESLSLEVLENEGRQSPNMDVLPWEYPETLSKSPPVYQPSGFHPPPQFSRASAPPPKRSQDPITKTLAPNHTSVSLPAPAIHFNSANQPIKYFPDRVPQRHSMISTQSYVPSHHSNPPSSPLPDPPTSPPFSHQRILSHHLSNESFDSAAPPPIRTTPHPAQHRISVEGRLSQVGMGHEKERRRERVRIRTTGR